MCSWLPLLFFLWNCLLLVHTKPAESFLVMSVLIAIAHEVGQRQLEICKKMRGICWAFHSWMIK